MNPARFDAITTRYPNLRIAVLGDFCLDRYLEIDPDREETSIETGLPVHNVVNVRSAPGGAGTILNNLVALGVGSLIPIGFSGEDAEGHELLSALAQIPTVNLDHFRPTRERRTFCYTKPLVLRPGKPPEELNRLDFKNWTPTPNAIAQSLTRSISEISQEVDALIVLDQVDIPETGVVAEPVRTALAGLAQNRPDLFIIADSRRGLSGFPPLSYKMNAHELAQLSRTSPSAPLEEILRSTAALADQLGRPAFVTLAERGIVGAVPAQSAVHLDALPCEETIDVVGAGDAVTANLAAAFAAGAQLPEALTLANAAASIVIHQLGTTGTASVEPLRDKLFP